MAASSTGMDNLIGAVNTDFVFRATTTAELVHGDVIQISFPQINMAQPFTLTDVVLATSTNIQVFPNGAQGTPEGVGFGGNNGSVVYGYVSSTVPNGTAITIRLSGIRNASGQLQNLRALFWQFKAGTPSDAFQPAGSLSPQKMNEQSNSFDLVRAGGALVSDRNSSITPSAFGVSVVATYTFSITATSSIPIGGKIIVNLPSEYSLSGVTVDLSQSISNTTAARIASFTTSTGQGMNQIALTTGSAITNVGDVLTVVIGGLTNPATAGVYRPFTVYTTKSNSGLLDGSTFGFEPADYGGGSPPPSDTVHIGGTNVLNVLVNKQTGISTSLLTGDELNQVKVNVGCPDKQFFVGEKWLGALSTATYTNLLDCTYMVGSEPFNKGDNSFYSSFLPPAFKSVSAIGGQTVTSTLTFGVPDATTTLQITGGVVGQNAFVHAFSSNFESFSPVFAEPTLVTPGFSATGTGYVGMRVKSGDSWNFDVQSGEFGNQGNFSNGGAKYWPPQIPAAYIGAAGTKDLGAFPYLQADKTLYVNLVKVGGGGVANACVGIKRSGGGMFMGAQDTICQPNYDSNSDAINDQYSFKVPSGSVTIEVMRQGFGKPENYPVGVTATTTKTITLSGVTSYITVTAVDGSGTRINGAPIFAHGSNGNGQGMTNSNGTTTIYVAPGTYVVEGFAPGFGPLTAQNVTVTGISNPSVTFTVDSGNFKRISGRVTSGGSGVAGVKIGAHGTGATTGGNGTETDANGNYLLFVPAGIYEVGGWSPAVGGFSPQTVDVSSANQTGVNWALGGQGTLRINVANAADLDPLFGGVFDPATGRGNGSNTWTVTGGTKTTDISLPAGTYDIHVGSPLVGEITVPGDRVTIVAGETATKSYDVVASDLVTLSGQVTSTAGNVSGANVWASRIGGPGFFSTQTDSSGNYSITLPNSLNYRVGVKILGYVAANGDEEVSVSGDTTKNFTMTAAASSISGTVVGASSAAVPGAWVQARKIVDGREVWTGGPTDASGAYSLSVDSGTWTLYADGPCYPRSSGLSASAGSSGNTITLTLDSGCTIPTPQINGVTAASGGQVSKNDLVLDIPANALGTAQSTVSVQVQDTSVVVSSANATPLANSVQSVTATDSSGQAITSLNSNASLTITYDPTELPNGFDEGDLQMGYFDTDTGQWEAIASTVNTSTNQITAQINHFTDYGPILPGVPTAPSGLAASTVSASSLGLSWTATPSTDYYVIYRSLTNSNFVSSIATTTAVTYTDTGLSASTRYYYKVAGYNENGEGSNSDSANALTDAAAAVVVSNPGGGGVGGGGGSLAPVVTTYQTYTHGTTTTPVAAPVSPVISAPVVQSAPTPSSVVAEVSPKIAQPTTKQPIALKTIVSDKGVVIVRPNVAAYRPKDTLTFSYSYKNATKQSVQVRIVRQVKNAKGKVIQAVSATTSMRPGTRLNRDIKERVNPKTAPGNYTVEVLIQNRKTGKVLAKNSFAMKVVKK